MTEAGKAMTHCMFIASNNVDRNADPDRINEYLQKEVMHKRTGERKCLLTWRRKKGDRPERFLKARMIAKSISMDLFYKIRTDRHKDRVIPTYPPTLPQPNYITDVQNGHKNNDLSTLQDTLYYQFEKQAKKTTTKTEI